MLAHSSNATTSALVLGIDFYSECNGASNGVFIRVSGVSNDSCWLLEAT